MPKQTNCKDDERAQLAKKTMESKPAGVTDFLAKLWAIAMDPNFPSISFNSSPLTVYEKKRGHPTQKVTHEAGTCIILRSKKEVEADLPLFFKHSQLSSVVRQLNMYNVRKVGSSESHIYTHPNFVQGKPDLLLNIFRKCPTGGAGAGAAEAPTAPRLTPSQSSSNASLIERIETLESEKTKLTSELEAMKEDMGKMWTTVAQLSQTMHSGFFPLSSPKE